METPLNLAGRESALPSTTTTEAAATYGPPAIRLWGLALAVALAAGFAAYLAGEANHGRFHDTFSDLDKETLSNKARANVAIVKLRTKVMAQRGAIYYGALGGLLGLGLGLAGGLARGSTGTAVAAGLIGLVLAGAAGAVAGLRTPAISERLYAQLSEAEMSSNVVNGLMLHAAIFLPIGLAAGLALGAACGGSERALCGLIGGLIGAALATALYEFVGLSFFHDAEPSLPLPGTAGMRLFALLAVAAGTALGAAFGVLHLSLTPTPPARPAAPKAPRSVAGAHDLS